MKKTLILTAAAGMLFAASPAFAQGIIVKKDGTEIKTTEKITVSEKGDYRYTDGKTKAGRSIKKSEVKWAWCPKPDAIRKLDESGKGTSDEYQKLAR